MAAILVFAITAEREIVVMRQRGQNIKLAGPIRIVHFDAELAFEFCQAGVVFCGERFFDKFRGRGEVRKPDVIIVEFREVGFMDAARRTADCADADAFGRKARRAELDNVDQLSIPIWVSL
jgi:hypothetical protein